MRFASEAKRADLDKEIEGYLKELGLVWSFQPRG